MTTKYGCAAYSGTPEEFQKGTATYVGWLSGKALVQRIDCKIYKDEFFRDHFRVKVLRNEWEKEMGFKTYCCANELELLSHVTFENEYFDFFPFFLNRTYVKIASWTKSAK